MSRSKKRQKKGRPKARKANPQRSRQERVGPKFVRHPLSGIPPDVLRSHAIQYARESEVVFQEILAEIQSILREVDPLNLIAQLAMYGLYGGLREDGRILGLNRDKGFGPWCVELVQALSLQLSPQELGADIAGPNVVQRCFDNLPKLSDAFAAKRMVALEARISEQEKAISWLQEHLRLHTQAVRNWGYADKVMRILTDLASYLDKDFLGHIGVSATQILHVFQYLLKQSERNATARFRKLRRVFQHETIDGMVRTYNELFECVGEDEDEFIEDMKRTGVPVEELKFLLITHSDLRLKEMFTFAANEVSHELKVSENVAKLVLDSVSLSFGDCLTSIIFPFNDN